MTDYFVGSKIEEVDTPVLAVELDILQRNIHKASEFFSRLGVSWRPHTKGQKVPAIAHMELEAGAIGITCAKLGEAEVMAAAGIDNILIANQLVGRYKAIRLANLCRRGEIIATVDSMVNAEQLAEAGRNNNLAVPVVVEVDIGMQRCGVPAGDEAVKFSRQVADLPGLEFRGVMGWEGHARRHKDPEKRSGVCREAVESLVNTAQKCRELGLKVGVISCGGTGTHDFSSRCPGITEIQAGGIIFNDMYYAGLGLDYDFALTVVSTVTSRPDSRRIVTDAGKKTMSTDTAQPCPRNISGISSLRFSAEHGVINTEEPNCSIEVGDRIIWVVGYGDTTVALHDRLYGVRNGRVEVAWPVAGRGKIR